MTQQKDNASLRAPRHTNADVLHILTDFSRDMGTISDLSVLSERIVTGFSLAVNLPDAILFLLDKEKEMYHVVRAQGSTSHDISDRHLPLTHPLPTYLVSSSPSLIDRGNLKGRSLSQPIEATVEKSLDSFHAEICVPLINKNHLVGFCLLGPTSVDFPNDPLAYDLLTALGQNAANALDNMILYEDLRRSQTFMRRTDRLRSLETIAGGFAHEIRNPLTSIKTFIQLAPDRKDDPEFIVEFSRVVLDDVYRIERLIQEILDYARYMEPKLTEEDLTEIVSSCLYFVEVKANSQGITIEKAFPTDLPRVMLDRQQIKQVLLNLLLNAMDAMSGRGGQLRVATHKLTKGPGQVWVQVEIQDTGTGIDAADLEHIFDPFFTTKHESGEHEGTGLGLTIAHQIIREHHGEIQVASAEGVGTTFYINIPAIPSPS